MSAPTAALPEWVTETPSELEYDLTMYAQGESIELISLSRYEYIDLKGFLAGLRGFAVPVPKDDAEHPLPEWLTHTPEEPTTHPNFNVDRCYSLEMSDGTGEIPQLLFMDRAEFEFLKRCLAARRQQTPSLVKEEGQ